MIKTKVVLVGPYPPPYGGLAVQLCQWRQYLQQLGTYECAVLDIGESRTVESPDCIPVTGYFDFLRKINTFCRNGYLVHLLTNGHNLKSWLSSFACAIAGAGYGKRTLHVYGSGDAPNYLERGGAFIRLLAFATMKLGGRFVVRNEPMKRALIALGADPDKVSILPGFLGVGSVPSEMVPSRTQEFINTHSPVLGATGNLDPEYGIPLMFAAVEALKSAYPRIGLLIMGLDEEARSQIEGGERVREQVFLTGPLPHPVILSVMKQLTAFLRPTYFDGDSLSVREALALGVPVVASDTDFRPEGVILFRKGQTNDFADKIRYVLSQNVSVSGHISLPSSSGSAERLLSIYRGLAGENG